MKALLIASIYILAVSAGPKHHELEGYTFEQYCEDFEKSHLVDSAENKQTRENIFSQNLEEIKAHNNANHSWKKGVNEFSDLTYEEFKQSYLGNSKNMRLGYKEQNKRFLEQTYIKTGAEVPTEIDWRDYGVVTPVKAQGKCGSCWAFAATETIESHAAIASNKLVILSPQQITSCATPGLDCGGVGGCSGSVAQNGFYYNEFFSLTTEEEYPYLSGLDGDGRQCAYNASTMSAAAKVDGHITLPTNDEEALIEAIATTGPVAISIYAFQWHQYESGIFDGCDFGANIEVDHAVQVVGYAEDYFIVRNSWGPNWGEDGFIRLERTEKPLCGIDNTPLIGAACTGDGQASIVVCGQCGILSETTIPIGARIL